MLQGASKPGKICSSYDVPRGLWFATSGQQCVYALIQPLHGENVLDVTPCSLVQRFLGEGIYQTTRLHFPEGSTRNPKNRRKSWTLGLLGLKQSRATEVEGFASS
jgi:hypothetical protein